MGAFRNCRMKIEWSSTATDWCKCWTAAIFFTQAHHLAHRILGCALSVEVCRFYLLFIKVRRSYQIREVENNCGFVD